MDQKTGSTNIKVAVRIRPLLTSERADKLRIQWSTQNNTIYQIDENGQKYGEFYSFDHIFGVDRTNVNIYNDVVKDFVIASLDGLNSTIFAYGQTSSGKTYTMLGNRADTGVMSLAIENIFDIIENNITRKFLIRVSYIEIYNEKINDLLDTDNKDVKIREVYPSTIVLQNIKEEIISTREQMYECLKRGTENKKIGMTKANDKSSRSHTIFRIMIESTQANDMDGGSGGVQVSNLNLVDLAGSERVAQTKATGMRLKEGGHINKSLSALGLVIKQLSDGQDFVNFRDSKLTRLLQDSLGGNSKTLIIATITLVSIEDTASTLAFAQRAKTVRNKPQVNEILSDADVSKRYAALNAQLQMKLEEQKLINQKLQVTQQENQREMRKLQQQMELIEDFQYGKRTLELKGIPKRRHTIGFSAQKRLFPRLPPEEAEKSNYVPDNRTHVEDFVRGTSNALVRLETIVEEAAPVSLNVTTPENILKTRLTALEQDYNELVTYTRDEDNILSETSKKVEELEEQLEVAKIKILEFENQQKLEKEFIQNKFKIREQELCDKIFQLEEQLKSKEKKIVFPSEDITEVSYIMEQLIHLQDILSCSLQSDNLPLEISYANLKEENQKLEEKNLMFAKQLENLNQEIKIKTDENINLFEEVNKLKTIVTVQTGELNTLLSQLEDRNKTVSYINHQNELLKNEVELIRNENKLRLCQEKEIEQLRSNNQLLSAELERNKIQFDEELDKVKEDLRKEISSITRENEALKKEVEDVQNENKSRFIHEKKLLTEEIEQLRSSNLLLSAEINTIKIQADEALNEVREDLQKEIARLTFENESLKKETEHVQYENKSRFTHEKELLTEEIEQLRSSNHLLIVELDTIKIQSDEVLNKVREDLHKEITRLTLENESLKNEMEHAQNEKKSRFDDEKERLTEETERLLSSNQLLNGELNNIKVKLDELSFEMSEKNKVVSEIEMKCGVLTEERENLKNELDKTNVEKNYLCEKIKELDAILSSRAEEFNKLNSETVNKNKLIEDYKTNCRELKCEKESLEQKFSRVHEELKNSDQKNESLSLEIQKLKLKINDLTQEGINKDSLILATENKYVTLKEERDQLKKELINIITEKDFSSEDLNMFDTTMTSQNLKTDTLKIEQDDIAEMLQQHRNNYALLKHENKSMNEKFLNTRCENDILKKEINELKSKIERLQNPYDDYQSTIIKHRSTINILEQKLKLSELNKEKQIHLLNSAQCEINDLKATLAEKERSVSEINHYKCQLAESNAKLEDCLKHNEYLNSQIQDLRNQIRRASSDNTVSDLRSVKEKITKLLYNIIVHFINEQKAVLVICHPQEQSDHFRNVVEDIKRDNMILKDLLTVIQTQNCDFSNISNILISCSVKLKKYYNLDKQFINVQVEQLELSNKAYHQEIMVLKHLQQDSKENACPQCKKMVTELSQLSKVKNLQEEMLNILKDKNTVLGKENINRVKQIVDLQTKIYEEQDKKAEIQYTEWIKFYQENDKVQQQQIQKLQSQIEEYRRSTTANKSCAHVQCDLPQLEPSMQDKYNLMKALCVRRNTENAALKSEIENLKKCGFQVGSSHMEQTEANKERNTHSSGVQCDILDPEKYSAMKKICLSRKLEIETLKRQLMTSKSTP